MEFAKLIYFIVFEEQTIPIGNNYCSHMLPKERTFASIALESIELDKLLIGSHKLSEGSSLKALPISILIQVLLNTELTDNFEMLRI